MTTRRRPHRATALLLAIAVAAPLMAACTADDTADLPPASAATAASATTTVSSIVVGSPPARPAAPAAPAPPGCASDGELEVCFSSPGRKGDGRVIDRMRRLFRSAGEGDALRIAMFRWEIAAAADDLLAAQARGARVEIVADRDVRTNRVGRRLLDQLERRDRSRDNVVVCDGACLPWRAAGPPPGAQNVNHLKLILADVDGVQSVVSTSSNIVPLQYRQWNSLVRVADRGLYEFELAHFARLRRQSTTAGGVRWDDRDKVHTGTPTAYVYPNRNDLVVNVLRRVQCAPGMRRVDVLVAVIQRSDVRKALGRLDRAGCQVRIVVGRESIENWLQAPVGGPRGWDIPNDRVRTIALHDKVYAIHAKLNGKESYVVLTGTSNTTCGGFQYNDEIMMRLTGRWVFQQYGAHVDQAYRAAYQSPDPQAVPTQAACR